MKRFLLLFVMGLFVLGAITALMVYQSVFAPATLNTKPHSFFVGEGETVSIVNQRLYENGILGDGQMLYKVGALKNFLEEVKPGHYILEPRMSLNSLINQLKSGNQSPVKVTFNQAKSWKNVVGELGEKLMVDSVEIGEAVKRLMTETGDWDEESLNALFIPNTYELWWTISAEDLISRMEREFQSFWSNSRKEKADALGLHPTEVATLASIVQSETHNWDEMPIVARLYLNRLDQGWKLQSDPTVIYALKRDGKFEEGRQRVLYKDLEYDSPYNTYIYKGLPPGPIVVPHPKTIDAVLDAPDHNYMYMCANPDKPTYHSFARNMREHDRNKAKYVRWLRENNIKR